MQVTEGPIAWAEAMCRRLETLPAIPVVDASVHLSRGSESAFGMCGVLRPILSLERMPSK